MADVTINGLSSLASPAADDVIAIWDTSAGQTLKIRRDTFVGATITGTGTIATGGFTFTVPATGTAALLGTANVFTANQTIQIGTPTLTLTASSGAGIVTIGAADNGANSGAYVYCQRNTNASTPAAGHLILQNLSAANYRVWPDASGNVRISTAVPTNANDTTGTVVGTQTSHAAFKHIVGLPVADADALANLVAAAATVARFVYKSGAYNGEEFSGIVLDGDALHRYGMDADAEHPAGKSLNVINVIGDLLLAVRHLSERVAQLEAQLA